ncbi:MAG: hydrolase 1, exosortase A system-associated [Rhodospirillaceae bacterium]
MTAATPIAFECVGAALIGVLHGACAPARRGVVIVVGGPNYRVGSHRQFLLLARRLAAAGVPVLRFDCRGMGDSDGDFPGFEAIGPDIRAAVDALCRETGVTEVVLWGLCDAASAILFYAGGDARVRAIAIANPWVRTVAGQAKAEIRHHYAGRLASGAFWRRLLTGDVAIGRAVAGAAGAVVRARRGGDGKDADLPGRMAAGLARFAGPVLMLISGDDMTAREFDDACAASPTWRGLLAAPRVTRHELPAADHTFSTRAWRDEVAARTVGWVNGLG